MLGTGTVDPRHFVPGDPDGFRCASCGRFLSIAAHRRRERRQFRQSVPVRPCVRIDVARDRTLYWDGNEYARWPSGRLRNGDGAVRWPFKDLVAMIRVYAGPGRRFELSRRSREGAGP